MKIHRKTQLRENFLQWYLSVIKSDIRIHSEIAGDNLIQKVLQQGIEEFPFNGAIVWSYVDWYGSNSIGRLHSVKLFKEDNLSQMFALAFVLQNFSQLYMKYGKGIIYTSLPIIFQFGYYHIYNIYNNSVLQIHLMLICGSLVMVIVY